MRQIKSFILSCKFLNSFIKKTRRKISARNLFQGIAEKEKAIIVYDHLVSPLAYGEFFYTLMLARLFLAQGLEVTLFVVDGEYRADFKDVVDSKCKQFLSEQQDMANLFVGKHGAGFKYQRESWPIVARKLLELRERSDTYIHERRRVFQRQAIYADVFNTINQVFSVIDSDLLGDVLLSKNEFLTPPLARPHSSPFIGVHVRYNESWGAARNTTADVFIDVIEKIKISHNGYRIIIISDSSGCNFFKKIARENHIECLFSKDFSPSFFTDAVLLLNSHKYLQLNGGGLGSVALFSFVPYEITCSPCNEVAWSRNTFTAWQTPSQYFQA